MPKQTYEVVVKRTSYAYQTIEVEAESLAEAQELAVDRAGNYIFSEKSADYEVDDF